MTIDLHSPTRLLVAFAALVALVCLTACAGSRAPTDVHEGAWEAAVDSARHTQKHELFERGTVRPVTDARFFGITRRGIERELVTRSEGGIVEVAIPHDVWRLSVRAPGFAPRSVEVLVDEVVQPRRVELAPAGVLTVRWTGLVEGRGYALWFESIDEEDQPELPSIFTASGSITLEDVPMYARTIVLQSMEAEGARRSIVFERGEAQVLFERGASPWDEKPTPDRARITFRVDGTGPSSQQVTLRTNGGMRLLELVPQGDGTHATTEELAPNDYEVFVGQDEQPLTRVVVAAGDVRTVDLESRPRVAVELVSCGPRGVESITPERVNWRGVVGSRMVSGAVYTYYWDGFLGNLTEVEVSSGIGARHTLYLEPGRYTFEARSLEFDAEVRPFEARLGPVDVLDASTHELHFVAPPPYVLVHVWHPARPRAHRRFRVESHVFDECGNELEPTRDHVEPPSHVVRTAPPTGHWQGLAFATHARRLHIVPAECAEGPSVRAVWIDLDDEGFAEVVLESADGP